MAIDHFNQKEEGEDQVKKIASLFKVINLEQEGMQFYIAFIFTGNSNDGEVKEASVVYALEQAVLKMFKAFDKASQSI